MTERKTSPPTFSDGSRRELMNVPCLVALFAVFALLAGCGGEMKPSELDYSLRTIESTAAEAQLLASHAADDRSKTTFVRVRARELNEELDHEAEKLTDADAAPGVDADKERALDLIDRISTEVGEMQIGPEDEARLREASTRLQELADAAEALREQL